MANTPGDAGGEGATVGVWRRPTKAPRVLRPVLVRDYSRPRPGVGERLRRLWWAFRVPVALCCMLAGLVAFGRPVWSGWWAAHAQSREAATFHARMANAAPPIPATGGSPPVSPTLPVPPVSPPVAPAPAPTVGQPPRAGAGGVLAELQIGAIGVDAFVKDGLTYDADVWTRLLRNGPAHVANTALPGQPGNAVIFGHLNIWGSVFFHLAQVRPGDTITLTDPAGTFTYTVSGTRTILDTDLAALTPIHAGPATLQLVTCEVAVAQDRLLVEARLTGTVAPPAPPGAGLGRG